MRKIACVVMAILLGVFLSASIVFAGNMYAPKFKNRIVAQQKRINQGRASGCLTRAELGILQSNLNRIMVAELRFKVDGNLTKRERVKLHRQLNHNSRMIYSKKHNWARRWY